MDFLISRRPKEELVLSLSPKVYVSEQIVQYLALHQINGIRFLFKNVKNVSTRIPISVDFRLILCFCFARKSHVS